jgi:AcrR family transcriptional regulator
VLLPLSQALVKFYDFFPYMVLTRRSDVTIKSSVNDVVTQSGSPNRTQRRASKTRIRLLKAALSVFAEAGTDAATIEMITQRADLGKGTFYRHFADKSEIIGALIEQCVGDLLAVMSRAAGEPHSLQGALDGLVNGHVEFFLSHQEEYILLFQGRMLLKLDRGVACDIERPYEDYLHCVQELVWPFLPKPVDDVKIRRLACAVTGFVSGFLSFAMITMKPEAVRESIKPLRDAFLRGVISFMEQP